MIADFLMNEHVLFKQSTGNKCFIAEHAAIAGFLSVTHLMILEAIFILKFLFTLIATKMRVLVVVDYAVVTKLTHNPTTKCASLNVDSIGIVAQKL